MLVRGYPLTNINVNLHKTGAHLVLQCNMYLVKTHKQLNPFIRRFSQETGYGRDYEIDGSPKQVAPIQESADYTSHLHDTIRLHARSSIHHLLLRSRKSKHAKHGTQSINRETGHAGFRRKFTVNSVAAGFSAHV